MIDETNLFVLDFFRLFLNFFFFSNIYYSEWKREMERRSGSLNMENVGEEKIRNLKHDFDLFPIMEKGFYIFNKIERMMGMY